MADVNTRRQPRYQAVSSSTLELSPSGTRQHQTVRLLDINQSGGMGLFIPAGGAFEQCTLTTFLGPWNVTRHTRAGDVTFEVRIFNAIPRFYDGRQGIRVSALPSAHVLDDTGARFFFGMRRRSQRNNQKRIAVRLSRAGTTVTANVINIGNDDGVGLAVDAPMLGRLTWGTLFADGWEITAQGHSLPCFLQRIAHHESGIVAGTVVPGITRGPLKAGEPAATSTPAGIADDQLLELLNQVLKPKPKKS